jgi:S1-C subfamily serine protease
MVNHASHNDSVVRSGFRRSKSFGAVARRVLVGLWATLVCAGNVDTPPTVVDPNGALRVKSGTGFFVTGDGYVITSGHVVAGCPGISVWSRQGSEGTGKIVALNPRLDIALISTGGGAPGYATTSDRPVPRAGEPVFTLGYGVVVKDPHKAVLTSGTVAGGGTNPDGDPVLVLRARFSQGTSGGAVVDARGALLGMVIGYYTDRPGLGVALPMADIETFLSANGLRLSPNDRTRNAPRSPQANLAAISVFIQCSMQSSGDEHPSVVSRAPI